MNEAILAGCACACLAAAVLAASNQPPKEGPLEVSADAMPADAGGDVIEARGNVHVRRGTFTMTADYLRYEKKPDAALVTGEVHASDGTFDLTCRRLRYYATPQVAIAWDDPLASRSAPLPEGGEELAELRATQITVDLDDERMQGLDKVELTRWTSSGGHRTLDVKVRCDRVDIDQVARTTQFYGGVDLRSAEVHAKADRALLEEPLDRLTLVGDAEAWTPGPNDEKLDRVRGAKILHFLKQKRSIVFGNVDGKMRVGQ